MIHVIHSIIFAIIVGIIFSLGAAIVVAIIEIISLKKEATTKDHMYEFWSFYQAKNDLCDAQIALSIQRNEIIALKLERKYLREQHYRKS